MVTITPDILQPGSCRVLMSNRPKYKLVQATYMDRASGKKKTVSYDCKSEGTETYEIGTPLADEAEAIAAAKSKAGELDRQTKTFSASVIGNPAIKAGMPLIFIGVRAAVDGVEFIIDTATHRFSKSGGYVTDISGQLK